MREKARIMDAETMGRSLTRIAHEIVEKNKGTAQLCIIGIRTRGVYLAERLVKAIKKIEGVDVPVGTLDITLYRDDLTMIASQPVVRTTEIGFDITSKTVVLVDDVLYSGRTIRRGQMHTDFIQRLMGDWPDKNAEPENAPAASGKKEE